MNITETEQDVLRHAMGIHRADRAYRNRIVMTTDTPDHMVCEGLVQKGLMRRERYVCNTKQISCVYWVTMAGMEAIGVREPVKGDEQ